MNELNMKISKMKSTLNRMKTELSTIQHQTNFSPIQNNHKKNISSLSMKNIFYNDKDSNNNITIDKQNKILSYKSTRNHSPKKQSISKKTVNDKHIIDNTYNSNKCPIYKTINHSHQHLNNQHHRNQSYNSNNNSIQKGIYTTNYKEAGSPTISYNIYQTQNKKSRSNANSSQNSFNNNHSVNIPANNTSSTLYKQYNGSINNYFKRGSSVEMRNNNNDTNNNNNNNNNMFIDFTKGAAIQHKVKEKGKLSAKYKSKYNSFVGFYTKENNTTKQPTTHSNFNTCTNHQSKYLNYNIQTNNNTNSNNNNIYNNITKTISEIYGNELNSKLLLQKIQHSKQLVFELNPYLIDFELLYKKEHKIVEYENLQKWIEKKSKKLELYNKELELYKNLCKMIQNISPSYISGDEGDNKCNNNFNKQYSSYYNINTQEKINKKKRKYEIVTNYNQNRYSHNNRQNDNYDMINENKFYNLNY